MTIGVLYPLSNAYPEIGGEFMDGLKSCIKQMEVSPDLRFKTAIVGFGGAEKEVYAKAEKLLLDDEVDILVAYVDEKVLPFLYPLLKSLNKLMIVVNPGANFPINWVPQSNVIQLNLQHAFCTWNTGREAALQPSGIAIVATTFYDCGYLHLASMIQRFNHKNGKVVYNYINNQSYNDDFNIVELADYLNGEVECDNILCVFDSKPAMLFYNRLQETKTRSQLNLFASPMMMDSNVINHLTPEFNFNIEGFIPWHPSINSSENELYKTSTKSSDSVFSLLGWESGLLLTEILKIEESKLENPDEIIDMISSKPFKGPRGEMRVDVETHHMLSNIGRFSLKAGEKIPEITWVSNEYANWEEFSKIVSEGPVSGWTNTYLCY